MVIFPEAIHAKLIQFLCRSVTHGSNFAYLFPAQGLIGYLFFQCEKVNSFLIPSALDLFVVL